VSVSCVLGVPPPQPASAPVGARVCMGEDIIRSRSRVVRRFHPTTLIKISMVLSTNSGSFPSNSHVSASFRLCSDLGNSGIRQIVRNSMLMGRLWEGRILINLCGKNNVRNCDLLQGDFVALCRTVLGLAKGFFWCVVRLGKR